MWSLPLKRLRWTAREEDGRVLSREVRVFEEGAIVETLLPQLIEVLHLPARTEARPTLPKLWVGKEAALQHSVILKGCLYV